MKKVVALFILIFLLCHSMVFARSTPKIIDGKNENDFILDQMLPNPSVYLYGVDSNGFPLLLMNFSLTIPIFALDDNPLLRPFQILGRYAPTFHKKVKSLKSITLYLKMNQSKESSDGKYFYYKIVKLQCDAEDQDITYKDLSKWILQGKATYSNQGAGGEASVTREMQRQMDYISKLPIRNYSGVGSDTLKIILKRGKKYPIKAGHMNISMIVAALPYYKNPNLSYCGLKCNACKYDFVKDFMTDTNPKDPCATGIRKIYFGKIYTDNSIMNYYEISPNHNPNNIIIDSEVIMGNRINGCPTLVLGRTRTASTFKEKQKVPPDKCCPPSAASEEQIKSNKCETGNSVENNCIQTTINLEDNQGMILRDDQFMYDNIFEKQLPNTESVTPGEDSSDYTSTAIKITK